MHRQRGTDPQVLDAFGASGHRDRAGAQPHREDNSDR
jgi:hypothetical protein